MSVEPLVVIGIGLDGPAGLTSEARAHLAAARVLAGSPRQLGLFPDWPGERIVMDGGLDEFISRVRTSYEIAKTVLLATGDPLFYGIGRALLAALPREDLVFLPQVSSVQLAFACLKEPWHDACVVSVHGRPLEALLPAIQRGEAKIAVLTDSENNPAAIAALLRAHDLAEDYALWVCENLGGSDERVSCHSPRTLENRSFASLNVVVLLRTSQAAVHRSDALPLLGIPERVFQHRTTQRGLITKREIRLMALAHLELHEGDVLWDIGAGSGSIALEAARQSPSLEICAVERDAEAFEQLKANIAALAPGRVRAVHGETPDVLADWTDPDAAFVGGSGGRLRDILQTVTERLKPGGRLVMTCITIENFARGWEYLAQAGFAPEAMSVQLAHSRPLGSFHCLAPDNVLFLLRARKR